MCRDDKPHDPDRVPKDDGSGTVMTIAVSASVFSAGLI
jgi:hypothetical protein